MKHHNGFTLIESIVAIVIMGFAMLVLVSFLYPQIERSATPHYQMRAAYLGQSVMSQILARGFDQQSDFDGGEWRCGETKPNTTTVKLCSATLGRDAGEGSPAEFNDVDDYIGCWYADDASRCGSQTQHYPLSNILGDEIIANYRHFTVLIDVSYVDQAFAPVHQITDLKRIELVVDTDRYGRYAFVAYRGNY
ncbi:MULTISPECIES: type IV pilus modification PilV family protein [Vibrio]|uniref:Type II secretion system protein n=1 Tax=Vibrio chanodichtyis TaxID=3027932 RepID=A0ABT5V4R6_9VIBR|nr:MULTISPECIES: type II secretion system protein [Vibrio]MDE1515803.1 type II secretion system protein [Vibrio chanodichtyis]